ncbi:hypothetical protein ANANG_G00034460, partial [Anguilla anguilla]
LAHRRSFASKLRFHRSGRLPHCSFRSLFNSPTQFSATKESDKGYENGLKNVARRNLKRGLTICALGPESIRDPPRCVPTFGVRAKLPILVCHNVKTAAEPAYNRENSKADAQKRGDGGGEGCALPACRVRI